MILSSPFINGFLILFLFTIRPFIYKPAARKFTPKTSAIFTAFWSVILCLITLPFYYDNLFVNGDFFIFNIGFVASFIKGFYIFVSTKNSQILNKESTSAAVFWGPIGFGFGSLINFIFLGEYLTTTQIIVILLILLLGVAFFVIGEGKKLSHASKMSFIIVLFAAVITIACDRFALMNMNWYAHILGTYLSMLLFSLIIGTTKREILVCINIKSTWIVGVLYALGEFILIAAMQYSLGVSGSILLARIAQSFGIVLAYHIYKEGTLGLQYAFAIIQILLSYFYFFI